MQLFNHQEATAQFLVDHASAFVTNDCGTGKTISVIEAFNRLREGRMLVLAPLSILENAWGADVRKYNEAFGGNLKVAIAHGSKDKRERAFKSNADIVAMNYEGCNWLVDNCELLDGFDTVVMDESTYVKNATSKRSKNALVVSRYFKRRWLLTGTPNPLSVLDLWHPALILDYGERLGKKFFAFRQQVCTPIQVAANANAIQWQDKPGALDFVHDQLSDITIRFTLEECIDMPETSTRYMQMKMPSWVKKHYNDMLYDSHIALEQGDVSAVHAGARARKLLQLLSGAVYGEEGDAIKVHSERHNLVMDLVEERDHTVVVFNYKHERDALIKEAKKRKLSYTLIDGSVPNLKRTEAVEDFQAGKKRVIFVHPQAAGHGITLTAANTLIWCSPNYNAELVKQTEHRIYRAGQKRRTQIIRIAYEDSKEIEVYESMGAKMMHMLDLLNLFHTTAKVA
ncbi:DEAD/DEAH box helicase [Parendozoicomonas haliclonae]|uniref:ATP-dependent RNA helicase RhlB n=1 Tax=Parendozoicomonas haliclonae TaxID=1960125 RepID=A0A1X7AE82_9GAMM|nr:DEAD/DEAH box helicase [Parendozoicomonas haliclonae]SMA33615.1 ATP-dependent RNA helicase RhlB [Parendozoicomonas haliclonae]